MNDKVVCRTAPATPGLVNTRESNIFRGTFWKIWRTQNKVFPQTYIEPEYGAFYWKNKVSVPLQSLQVQLSLRETSPLNRNLFE